MRVWLITEKCLRHSRHRYGIGRRYATLSTPGSPPQCGQTGPLGQRRAHELSTSAARSSGNRRENSASFIDGADDLMGFTHVPMIPQGLTSNDR